MAVGDTLEFKHISFNVKLQYPFGKRQVGMLVGGTGITPMIQALHAILGTTDDKTEVTMLYGSRSVDDVLAKATLDDWCSVHGSRLKVVHVLSHEPTDSKWDGERGFISKSLCEKHLPQAGSGGLVFVCGPPPMYEALCGA